MKSMSFLYYFYLKWNCVLNICTTNKYGILHLLEQLTAEENVFQKKFKMFSKTEVLSKENAYFLRDKRDKLKRK